MAAEAKNLKQANDDGGTKGGSKRSKSDDAVKKSKRVNAKDKSANIPFQLLMCNFRRKKIMQVIKDAQEGKMSFEERDSILEPYEQYIDRVLDDCNDVESELNISSKLEDRVGGLDMKRICEEIQENDSDTNSHCVNRDKIQKKNTKKLS